MNPTTPYNQGTAASPNASTIQRVEVISRNVKSVGHEGDVLEVEFHPGKDGVARVYRYTPVARAFFDRLFEGHSVGKLVHGLRTDHTVSVERVQDSAITPG